MNRKFAKLISLVLSLCLVLGMVPALAETAETTEAAETAKTDTAYIMYANADWSVSYWNNGEDDLTAVTPTNVEVTGEGDYTVSLEFANESAGLAFMALGIANGENTFPGWYLKINEIRVNGEAIEVGKGYTSSDDGITTRMNIYNEWVDKLPADARSFDGTTEDASWIIVDKEAFATVSKIEIDFSLIAVTDTAYLMFANADFSVAYWNDGNEDPSMVTATKAEVKGEGEYTVGLEFAQESSGLGFMAVGIVTGEKTFNGWFIDVTDIKVNGESIEVGKGYTSSDDGVTTRENIYNTWVNELPADARRADGDLEGASWVIVDAEAFAAVKSIEVTFNFIYGDPIVKEEEAGMTQEEIDAALAADYNAYIGIQSENYTFRNAWNEENYGRDAEDGLYFNRLTGWDADGNAVDYGGTFTDAQITGNGTYSVSLTTGDMGFGSDKSLNLLFVSTDIPSALVADGYVTITDVTAQFNDSKVVEYFELDTTGDYAQITLLNKWTQSEEPFAYTIPGANETVTITFTIGGLSK